MFRKKNECDKIKEMLSPYIDGELAVSDVCKVEGHVAECEACRAELDSLSETVGLLRQVGMVEPPRSFTIAGPVPARRSMPLPAYAALRAASAFATLLLAFVFIADASGAFGGADGTVLNWSDQDRGSLCSSVTEPGINESDVSSADYLSANESAEGVGIGTGSSVEKSSTWPVLQLEIGLSVAAVALAGASVFFRRRSRMAGVRVEIDDEASR
ncbi:MAG: zf-HC2 domain-containing protein [Chloroflexota bacterium]|nr:zf-HC2 domain-containing protein [Chloroflexota bacterium]